MIHTSWMNKRLDKVLRECRPPWMSDHYPHIANCTKANSRASGPLSAPRNQTCYNYMFCFAPLPPKFINFCILSPWIPPQNFIANPLITCRVILLTDCQKTWCYEKGTIWLWDILTLGFLTWDILTLGHFDLRCFHFGTLWLGTFWLWGEKVSIFIKHVENIFGAFWLTKNGTFWQITCDFLFGVVFTTYCFYLRPVFENGGRYCFGVPSPSPRMFCLISRLLLKLAFWNLAWAIYAKTILLKCF